MSEKKLIDSLTPEQEALIPAYLAEYLAIGVSTEPTDKAKAEAAILASYEYLKLEKPIIVWAKDPFEGQILAAQYAKGDENVTQEEVQAQADKASFGSFEAYWVSTYAFIAEVLPVEKDNLIDIVKDIVKNCGVYWTFEGLVVVTPKPCKIVMENEKLSCTTGPALAYESGLSFYFYDGEPKGSLAEVMLAGKHAKV